MGDFHFLRPYWLLLMLPALLTWYALWRQQDRTAAWLKVFDKHLLEQLVVGESTRRRLRPMHTLLVAWIVTAIALAGPAWQVEPSPFASDEAGLVVLLKVNGTMLASDIQPTRLARAKHKIRDLLELREGAATGLIVYSGSAHLVMPLTRDDRIISAMIEDLTPDLMPSEGDALADALRLAERLLQDSGVPGSVLVIADNVSPAQVDLLAASDTRRSVQFLSLQAMGAATDVGLQNAASEVDARVVELTVDGADVESLAQRAQSSIRVVADSGEGTRWVDAGYDLLPLLALLALLWSRRGWLVR